MPKSAAGFLELGLPDVKLGFTAIYQNSSENELIILRMLKVERPFPPQASLFCSRKLVLSSKYLVGWRP